MDAYVYRAALYCEDCMRELKRQIMPSTEGAIDLQRWSSSDSEDWPQGPYTDGGGESDTPAHCDTCHMFLENPLTFDGVLYVVDALETESAWREGEPDHDLDAAVTDTWRAFYAAEIAEWRRNAATYPSQIA